MNILCIGDVVGRPGREALEALLPDLRREYEIDATIVNAENAAGGSGLTKSIAERMFEIGCDVLTLGDHVWDQKDLTAFLDESKRVIRPANFPSGVPGRGATIVTTAAGIKIGVINLLGRVFMRYQVDCPFRCADKWIDALQRETAFIVIDMHAETTSEKCAMGHYVDGRVSAVFGTHTHIQTADDTILSNGTAYITDLGMTGPYDSVIGQNKQNIIDRFLTSMPVKFSVASDDVQLSGIVVDIDKGCGKAKSVMRIQRRIGGNIQHKKNKTNKHKN